MFIVLTSLFKIDTVISLIYTAMAIMLLIVAIFYFDIQSSTKTKINQQTIIIKPHRLLAKLILPDGQEMIVKDYEIVLGREDFLGIDSNEKLKFIGKKHLRLIKLDDGFYIEDLKSKNGTTINGSHIKGLGKIKLKNGDKISIANVLKIVYLEELTNS